MLETPGGSTPTNGGADVRTIATNLTLTAADGRLQKLYSNPGIGTLDVFLPDATTLTEGGPVFIIKNDGFNTFNIRDASGNLLAIIGTKQMGSFNLVDNSTIQGSWTVGNQSYTSTAFADLLFGSFTPIGTIESINHPCVIQMTENTYLGSYVENTTFNVMLIPFSVSTNIVTYGTPLISSSVTGRQSIVTKMENGKAVLFYIQLSGGNTFARVVNMSGLTLTLNTELNLGFSSVLTSAYPAMEALTTTTALLCTGAPLTANQEARVLTISGNTVVGVGSPAIIAASRNSFDMKVISPTLALAVFQGTTSNIWNTATLSISGTTVTWNTITTILTSGGPALTDFHLTMLSPTKAIAVCQANTPGNDGYITLISILGGNAVPVGPILISTLSGVGSIFPNVVALRSDKAFVIHRNAAVNQEHYLIININGNTISTQASGILSATMFTYSKMLAPSTSKVITCGNNAGFNTIILENVDV